ncbi:hypothetical protein THO17_32480 [Marinomonas sp. THO17]
MAFFYLLIYLPVRYFIDVEFDSFAALPVITRVLLPVSACFVLAALLHFIPKAYQSVGVPYVVERLIYHGGNLPIWNGIVQFFTAAIGLAGGLSIGKEGPAVHLGATLASVIAVRAKLSQYGIETLLACGVAGAISALFQTPLAGVLFAFEVILLEYRQRYVLPVLLSSIMATLISHYLIGPISLFTVQSFTHIMISPSLFAACLLLAAMIVSLTSVFFHVQKVAWRFHQVSVWWRFSLVALLTAVCAVYIPESLGIGYGVLNTLLSVEIMIQFLFILVIVKTVLTAVTIGLGIPGGMIGPAFVIGGLAGVMVALIFGVAKDELALFALLGMAAMMATCFQAPLAALVAIIELTQSSVLIVPALLVIVLSCLIIRVVCHQESIFVERLKYMGMSSSINSFRRHLRHHKVSSVAENVLFWSQKPSLEQVKDLASNVVSYVAFTKQQKCFWVHSSAVLNALQTLEVGPQAWLDIENEINVMDLSCAVSSEEVVVIDEPASLEVLLNWFQETRRNKVLIRFSKQSYGLVSKRKLEQFLLKNED